MVARRWVLILIITLVISALTLLWAGTANREPSPLLLSQKDKESGGTITLCFYRDLEPACVPRMTAQSVKPDEARAYARALLEAMLAGPTPLERDRGLFSALPDGARLDTVEIISDTITVRLDLPDDWLYGGLDPAASDMIVHQIAAALEPLNPLTLIIQARDRQGNWQPLSYFLFEPPVEHKETNRPVDKASTPHRLPYATPDTPSAALAGKAVYISAGHGWYWSQYATWRTQRSVSQGLVEDFNNAEVINQYLIQYLRHAGADVWPTREHDMNTGEIIVARDSPDYSDQGDWLTSTRTGYGGVYYRYALVSAAATATATWTFTPTQAGRYAVYAWYLDGDNRTSDAHYLVYHAGGVSQVHINQKVHGATWRYIGTYPFAAGQRAQVTLTNQLATPGAQVVIADAIRIGGGLGSLTGDTPPGSVTSGRPRWEEAARYWAKYQGAPPSVYDPVAGECSYGLTDWCDDVTARPRYAEWEKPADEDAVYISWHTNGYNGTARGTESYIYLTPTAGSDTLQAFVHSTLINDIRAGWDPTWIDRGAKRRDLGEVRLLSTMPGVLLEIAFHDHPDDANALKDPRFGQLTARAVYKGIVRYFAYRDGRPPVFLPEPPKALAARNLPSSDGTGALRLDWLPSPTDTIGLLGDAATAYRIYTSSDGLGWSHGLAVTGTAYTLTGLLPGQLVFARVTGVNAGGESFPTPVVGARVGWPVPVLIVDGFGRIDRRGLIEQNDGSNAGINQRMFLERINRFDYILQHGAVISLPFDSAQRRALGTWPVTLTGYAIVDWMAGEEQTPVDPLPPNAPEIALSATEQAALQNYMAGGGSLFISGTEIGYDLVQKNRGPDFYSNVLRATYLGDDAGTYMATPVAGSLLDGLPVILFDDGTHGTFNADWPDYFTPIGGARPVLTYGDGHGPPAALQYDSGGCSRLVYFGFPFETIYDAALRQAVMNRVIAFLSQCLSPETTIVSPQDGHDYQDTPPVTGTAWDARGVAAVRLTVSGPNGYWNGTTWQPTPIWVTATGTTMWSYTLPALTDSLAYTVLAQAWNTAGQADATPASVRFAIDTLPPSVPATITPTGHITIPGVRITLVFSPGLDLALAGHVIQIDDRLFTTTSNMSFTLPVVLPDGKHNWRVRAFDRAGNRSAPSSRAYFATVTWRVYLPVIYKP